MRKEGLPKDFVQLARKNYERKDYATVVKLNHLGFLHPPSHQKLVTANARIRSVDLLGDHAEQFDKVDKDYGVDPQVISALLWIETRHGQITGHFHTVSVYMHLMQAVRPDQQKALLQLAAVQNRQRKKMGLAPFSMADLGRRLRERTKQRSAWALNELRALAEMHSNKSVDVKRLRGSFAGAFGWPQFIPSSYQAWAVSVDPQRSPDLFQPADALASVANYLKNHGWNQSESQTHVPALMQYNQSRDYAESILQLAYREVPSTQGDTAVSDGRSVASTGNRSKAKKKKTKSFKATTGKG